MNKKLLILLIAFLSLSINCKTEKIEEIITVVSVTPQKINETVSTVDYLNENDLKKLIPKDLAAILSSYLAIDVSSNGGLGQYSSIFLRGTNSNQTLVKVNGIKINPYTAGGASIYNLDPSLITSIEIGSGPFSTIHGSEAIGGVINISTSNKEHKSFSRITASLGPDNFSKGSYQIQKTQKDKSIGLLLLNSATDGFPTLIGSEINNGYKNQSLISSFRLNHQKVKMDLASWHSQGKTEYLSYQMSPLEQDYKNSAVSVNLTLEDSNEGSLIINFGHSRDLISQNQINFLGLEDLTETKTNSLEFIYSRNINNGLFVNTGYMGEFPKVNYSSYGTSFKKKLSMNSYFLELRRKADSHLLEFKIRRTHHEIYKNQDSWNLGYKKEFSPKWDIRLNKGFAFRSPNSSELFGYGSNINLSPEESNGNEAALQRTFINSNLSLVIFENKIKNLIEFYFKENILKNINKGSNRGLELRYSWINNKFSGKFIIRSQDPKDGNGQQLLRRSKQSLSLSLFKEFNFLSLTSTLTAFKRKRDIGGIELPGYGLMNISLNKVFRNNLDISLRLENITNKNYFTASSFNGYYQNQDRSLWLNVSYKINKP